MLSSPSDSPGKSILRNHWENRALRARPPTTPPKGQEVNPPQTPTASPHTWGRGTHDETPGALIYLGRRDLFIAHDQIPSIIAKLTAIHNLTD